jgi:mRNA interferase RelE/StbE
MAEFRVFFKESAEKDLREIPKKDLPKILHRIKRFSDNPRPSGHEKLTGQERYRIRQGRYRVVYSIQDKEITVWIVKIKKRKDV